ncbi:6-O-methylguanine DNA methyltransferase [Coniochaeta sp. 2T2.1]|nr:6-O-methylguanine DNA methyltransferase [Coniochaeta sp. 2T2.1]
MVTTTPASTALTKTPPTPTPSSNPPPTPSKTTLINRILASPNLTPFQKKVYLLTLQIPPGSTSTYNLIALHLKSSPRAVGNALRRNPFAPDVPCHRVVATDGGLGGFKGKIGRRDGVGGIELREKVRLLRGEGVRFDTRGRVVGTGFGGFK